MFQGVKEKDLGDTKRFYSDAGLQGAPADQVIPVLSKVSTLMGKGKLSPSYIVSALVVLVLIGTYCCRLFLSGCR